MLEAVDTIATNGKIYRWAEYVAEMVKTICERCQETGGIIRFPSLILWIVMFYIFPEGDKPFQEPKKIPYVEIQAILPERNNEGTCRRKSVVGKLAPAAKSPHDQLEGASKHPMKSTQKGPHSTRAQPYRSVVHAGH